MSEEVRNPSIVVPKILVQTIAINGSLSLIFVIVLLFCTGNIERDLNTPTGYAIIEIFYQTTGSVRAATAMQALIATIGLSSNLAVVASVSRLTWAFARDGGLPYSSFFAHVSKTLFPSPRQWRQSSTYFFVMQWVRSTKDTTYPTAPSALYA